MVYGDYGHAIQLTGVHIFVDAWDQVNASKKNRIKVKSNRFFGGFTLLREWGFNSQAFNKIHFDCIVNIFY